MYLLRKYHPHMGQIAFHYAADKLRRFVAMICGIRGGKTHAGSRQATKEAWNNKGNGVYGIIAPTFHMLKRTTWREFLMAARPLIKKENSSDMIVTLKNGREVHGFSADKPDRIRNATLCGFWLDEGRECKEGIWDVLLGRVLSTDGRGILTTSPNSYDWIHEVFVESKDKDYGIIHFPTSENPYINKERLADLERKYDPKFARQELYGEFVLFEGAVYYTFSRHHNAGDLAFKLCKYNPAMPIWLCCDFNVDPMAWIVTQPGIDSKTQLKEIYVVDEIFLNNSNTVECCNEFKIRYPSHKAGVVLYGDQTGEARHTSSNVSNWKIIETELFHYGITKRIPSHNPAERDRINAVNGLVCNSKNERRLFVNPKCKHLIKDFEQVSFKEGSTQIDKAKDFQLTHPSDAIGYMIEKEFSLNKGKIGGLKI